MARDGISGASEKRGAHVGVFMKVLNGITLISFVFLLDHLRHRCKGMFYAEGLQGVMLEAV